MEDIERRVFIVPRTATDSGGAVKTALRLAMDSAGLGCHRLEKLSGVSHGTINNLANQKGGVDKRKAAAIADALGLQVWDLFKHGDNAEVA